MSRPLVGLAELAHHTDSLLRTAEIADYPQALNGVQVQNRQPLSRVAAAVDCSVRTIRAAIAAEAQLLLVHHGLFWGGLQRITGPFYDRLQLLLSHDIALYSSHLPLDGHAELGNGVQLAQALGLAVSGGFAEYKGFACGVQGSADLPTNELHERAVAFSAPWGHRTISSPIPDGHRTRRWAICTGSGAQVETLAQARALGIDTLIVGEGPHWSAVDADEHGFVIIYAGHYATETLGVRALAAHWETRFGLPWQFIDAPTGL